MTVLILSQSFLCTTGSSERVECWRCHQAKANATSPSDTYQCDPYEGGFQTALSGFAEPIVWMIFSAFHIGTAVKATRLGEMASLILLKHLGKSIIGVGFSIFISELVLGPFIPSNTARGGGIVLPIVLSLAISIGSSPTENSALGEYLIMCASHSNLLVSSMFVTACAPNPVIVKTAKKLLDIDVTFASWTTAAICTTYLTLVPAIICFSVLPFMFQLLFRPAYNGEVVYQQASLKLSSMGRLQLNELYLLLILVVSLALWMTASFTGFPATLVAFLALVAILLLKILSWDKIVGNSKSWDTFFWLSGMLVLAEQLADYGVAASLGSWCAEAVKIVTSSPVVASVLLSSV
jgi:divalent anion:Na+ symporter, DASS family